MEEKIIIKSYHYNIKKAIVPVILLSLMSSALILGMFYTKNLNHCKEYFAYYTEEQKEYIAAYDKIIEGYETEKTQRIYCDHDEEVDKQWWSPNATSAYYVFDKEEFLEMHPNAASYTICRGYDWYDDWNDYIKGKTMINSDELLTSAIPLPAIIIVLFIYWWLSSYALTVSDKRIYGKTSFGKRVDLPVDSVSAVSTSMLKGIAVATASGKIVFKLIKNRDEIHSEISNLIISRQTKPETVATEPTIPTATDELKKYKELLDMGAITQEEFDAKKKELLGL